MSKLSVILIAKNEELRIKAALESIKWADEIIVVDDKSADKTISIAKAFTDKVYSRKFDNFSSQKNFAISKCSNDWVFSLDCDESVTEELKNSIISAINNPGNFCAFKVERLNRLFGKILKNATKGDYQTRLFLKDKAHFTQPIHEFLDVNGSVGALEGKLLHNTTENIKSEFDKTESYTELEARWVLERNTRPTYFKIFFYPLWTFSNIYFLKKGFLDGFAGLLFAYVSARYTFVKYLKAKKLSRNKKYLEELVSGRFNKLSENFPDSIDNSDARLNKLIDALKPLEEKLVLEIGCGKGRFTRKINEQRARCVGSDITINLIKEASKKNKGYFVASSATALSFRPHLFDRVFAVEVIEHITDLKKCIKEAAMMLNENGSFVIIDRNILSLNNRRIFVPNFIVKKYHELKDDWMYPRGFPYREKWFLKSEILKLLGRYFSKVEAEYIISDSEKKSKTAFLFEKIPVTRHFILWKASLPR
ncbi:MAG: methyltransferase domain-containing protein [Candidatus Omnitrophota bacterium]